MHGKPGRGPAHGQVEPDAALTGQIGDVAYPHPVGGGEGEQAEQTVGGSAYGCAAQRLRARLFAKLPPSPSELTPCPASGYTVHIRAANTTRPNVSSPTSHSHPRKKPLALHFLNLPPGFNRCYLSLPLLTHCTPLCPRFASNLRKWAQLTGTKYGTAKALLQRIRAELNKSARAYVSVAELYCYTHFPEEEVSRVLKGTPTILNRSKIVARASLLPPPEHPPFRKFPPIWFSRMPHGLVNAPKTERNGHTY